MQPSLDDINGYQEKADLSTTLAETFEEPYSSGYFGIDGLGIQPPNQPSE
jgi:hypothetical protein